MLFRVGIGRRLSTCHQVLYTFIMWWGSLSLLAGILLRCGFRTVGIKFNYYGILFRRSRCLSHPILTISYSIPQSSACHHAVFFFFLVWLFQWTSHFLITPVPDPPFFIFSFEFLHVVLFIERHQVQPLEFIILHIVKFISGLFLLYKGMVPYSWLKKHSDQYISQRCPLTC